MPRRSRTRVVAGAVPADALRSAFPHIDLPVEPPYPPMEARLTDALPSDHGKWLYEPKWDGFRCLAFRRDGKVLLQSKAGQPLARYFPELVAALQTLPTKRFVLDGEIVISHDGRLSFDDLLMRIHPAESRIRKLAQQTPATILVFDMLVDARGRELTHELLRERRTRLERFFADLEAVSHPAIRLSPATADRVEAQRWINAGSASGLDGVMAKLLDAPYASGERTAMRKVKRIRTADCVVGGFRWSSAKTGPLRKRELQVGSLLLGLYDDRGLLDHVGFTSSFKREEREKLKAILQPMMRGKGFSGRAPGGPSRWSTERSGEWEPLQPKLVCEVSYDHFSGGRFRHGTRFLRWRPDKNPKECLFDQVERKPDLGFFLKTA
jgi:ATP-dependent DNA ligase